MRPENWSRRRRDPRKKKVRKVPIIAKVRIVMMLSKKSLLCREKDDSNIKGGSRIKKNKEGENWGSSFLALLQDISIMISILSSKIVWHSSRLKIIKPNRIPRRINKEDSGSFEEITFDLWKKIFATPQTQIKETIAKKILTSSHLQSTNLWSRKC